MSSILMSDKATDNGSSTSIVTKEAVKTQRPSLYKVILLNDDFTPMEFVVNILVNYFKKSSDEATAIMLRVHHEGQAVCGVYPLEIAETKVSAVAAEARKEGYPLKCICEKE